MNVSLPPISVLSSDSALLMIGFLLLVLGSTSATAQPFAEGRTISTSPNGTADVVTADVDGDGDTDVLSASNDDDTVTWYRNGDASGGGDGSNWTTIEITTTADHATGVAAADIDGDGDTDAVSASTMDGTVAWYRNGDSSGGGDGSNWTTTVITDSAKGARDVAVADVDGDGNPDILSAAFQAGTIAWHRNGNASGGGDGSTWTTNTISTSAEGTLGVQPADLDGDGDVDVLSAAGHASALTWYQNGNADGENDGSRWTSTRIANLEGANSVVAEDFDGDGHLDVAGGGFKVLGWYRNAQENPDDSWSPTFLQSAQGTNKVVAPDIDGDGDADLLSVDSGGNTIEWYRNGDENGGGTGANWTDRTIAEPDAKARSVAAADLDNDGDLDVIACDKASVTWFENQRK